MTKKPDATKIEAALKRAADKALHGTREERSGRFLVKDKQPVRRDDDRPTNRAVAGQHKQA
jgi:hypothetical protein